tara:strand:- start:421 stop:648 length:228 start_codon:yes stop_codon:yes gene_type:complete
MKRKETGCHAMQRGRVCACALTIIKTQKSGEGFLRAKAREGPKGLSNFKTEISKTPFQKNEIAFWKFLLVFTEPA